MAASFYALLLWICSLHLLKSADFGCRARLGMNSATGSMQLYPLDLCYGEETFINNEYLESSYKYICNEEKTSVLIYNYQDRQNCIGKPTEITTLTTNLNEFDCDSPVCPLSKYRVKYNDPETANCSDQNTWRHTDLYNAVDVCFNAYSNVTNTNYYYEYVCNDNDTSLDLYVYDTDDHECNGTLLNIQTIINPGCSYINSMETHVKYEYIACGIISTFKPTTSPISTHEPTVSPTPTAMSSSSDHGGFKPIYGVLIVFVILCIICFVVWIYFKRKTANYNPNDDDLYEKLDMKNVSIN